MTTVAGLEIPSTSPVFLGVVGFHVAVALVCVVAGALAMRAGPGRHRAFGSIYVWCLLAVFLSATGLSLVRWSHDYPLFVLGALAFAAALVGRTARRRRRRGWIRVHISAMGLSYVLLLTAFYVDNGRNLPLWRELPAIAFWLGPAIVGAPLIARAVLTHPAVRRVAAVERGREGVGG